MTAAGDTFQGLLRLLRNLVVDRPDPLALRRWSQRVERLMAPALDASCWQDHPLPDCNASWFRPAGPRPGRVLLYLHGGAFIMETPRLHGALVERLARDAGCDAFVPHYRLAPEHPYPAAPDDAFAAYQAVLASGVEPHHIVVAGDSAGGNLCLGLLIRLRDAHLPLPACAVAFSPVTDTSFSGESIQRNDGIDAMFTPHSFQAMLPLYLPDPARRSESLASPLWADLRGLPPLLLLAGSTELLLDDAVRFAQRCPGAQLQVWHGMPHAFVLFRVFKQAGQALAGAAGFIRTQLQQERPQPAASAAPARASAPAPAQAPAPAPDHAPALAVIDGGHARQARRLRRLAWAVAIAVAAAGAWIVFAH